MELWGASAKFGWSDGMERGGEMMMGLVLRFKVGLGDLGGVLESVLQHSRVGGRGIELRAWEGSTARPGQRKFVQSTVKIRAERYSRCNIILKHIYLLCAQL